MDRREKAERVEREGLLVELVVEVVRKCMKE